MTIEDKRRAIEEYCLDIDGCEVCPLYSIAQIKAGKENCFSDQDFFPVDVNRNYEILFGEVTEENPYWERITSLAERQRAKGMSKYGQGLEMNTADILERINHLQEELIDGLMYCEWIKEYLLTKVDNA